MSTDSYYFPHDYNASRDPNIVKLRRTMGAQGYGIFWLIVEKLYNEDGKMAPDYDSLTWDLHEAADKIKAVVEKFDLFYHDGKGNICSHSVDRRIAARKAKTAQARSAAYSRHADAEQAQSGSNAINKRKEIEERKTTTAGAEDFSRMRLPYGKHRGVCVCNLPVDECQLYLKDERIGRKLRLALQARIQLKHDDMTPGQRRAQGVIA